MEFQVGDNRVKRDQFEIWINIGVGEIRVIINFTQKEKTNKNK